MAKELYDGIYSSHRLIFIEKVQSNIETFLKDKVIKAFRAGQEVICHIENKNLGSVLKELIDNPEFNINILNHITDFSNKYGDYLLVNVSSSVNNYSMILKVSLQEPGLVNGIEEPIYEISKFFHNAQNYLPAKKHRNDVSRYSDLDIYCQTMEGLDCYDLFIQNDGDTIGDVYISDEIARTIEQDFFKDIEIINLISKLGTFDWKAAVFPELCFCINLEELLQLKVQKRVQYLRVLLCELSRISSHLSCLANVSRLLEYDFAFNSLILEKERVLRVLELITGSRIFPNFMRIGGLKRDLSVEMERKIRTEFPLLLKNLLRAQAQFFDNTAVIKRLRNKGVMEIETALKNGVTGPNLRSTGIRYDLRKNRNLLSYKDMSFVIPTGVQGDCLDRVLIRFQEIFQSMKIIKQVLEGLPDEYHRTIGKMPNFDFKHSAMVSNVECPHGTFKIYLEVEGNNIITLVMMGPSRNSLFNARDILKGESIEDLNLILSTLDISPGELLHW